MTERNYALLDVADKAAALVDETEQDMSINLPARWFDLKDAVRAWRAAGGGKKS